MKPTQKAGILSLVKQMIAKNLQNKRIGFQIEQSVNHNSAISGADCEPIVGEIVQLNTSSTQATSSMRIGDRITPKSLTVRGVVSLNPGNAGTSQQDFYVRVVIASQKSIKVGSQVLAGSVDANRLLKPGFAAADQVPFTGATEELSYPLNTDAFKVYYDKVFKLHASINGGQFPAYSKRWSYRFKSLPSTLSFDEGNGDWPNNFAPFVAIGYAYSDGTSPDSVTTRLITQTTSFLDYEDA